MQGTGWIAKEDVDRSLDSMVNKVAWAISASFHEEGYIEGQSDPSLFAEFEKAARRAIEAMRDPTDQMLEAGCRALAKVPPVTFMALQLGGSNVAIAKEKMTQRWRAMIDEALKYP